MRINTLINIFFEQLNAILALGIRKCVPKELIFNIFSLYSLLPILLALFTPLLASFLELLTFVRPDTARFVFNIEVSGASILPKP